MREDLQRSPLSVITAVLRGGGDLGSGVAYRLQRAGLRVIILELSAPILVRPGVSFGTAIYDGEISVEGVTAARASLTPNGIHPERPADIPVLVDPDGATLRAIVPDVLIDARMAKVNLGTRITDAPLVIGMGPGFTAGVDCHAVIETNRGHFLAHVIRAGAAEPDTGTPGVVNGRGAERVIRAPRDGHVYAMAHVGDFVREGQPIATIDDTPILAAFDGVLRGLIHPQVRAHAGQKIGDLDPRGTREHCFTISDKALSIGGGALEAILSTPAIIERLVSRHAAQRAPSQNGR